MNRRRFLASTLTASLAVPALRAFGAEFTPSPTVAPGWRRFEVTTRVTLPAAQGPAELWLPLAQTAGGYQVANAPYWECLHPTECVDDPSYGASVLHTSFHDKDRPPYRIEVTQTVLTRDRAGASPMLPLTAVERRFWTAPAPSLPLDGPVLETSARITAGKHTPRERLRAIYDWVVDHTHRDPDVPGCGRGDPKRMLESGQMGGKCADINSLLVALSRAAGLPARDVYGVRVAPSRLFPSIGADGDISKAQHCRAEVFLDGEGWFPIDAGDVIKVIAVEKLTPGGPEARAFRDHQFGNWEMNWVAYNSATDIQLPGAADAQKPDFAFLMFPCAWDAAGQRPGTDPANFHYELSAREVPV